MNSRLKQERLRRGWSRPQVEELTGGKISVPSLERWEQGRARPRDESIMQLCNLYEKTPEDLMLDGSHDIMGTTITVYASQEGITPMSETLRRIVSSNLGSRLSGLIDTWPHRNYRYEELQCEMSRAITDHHAVGEATNEYACHQALVDTALVPIQLRLMSGKKIDTGILLKHCAAGITACWYLRRGRDLDFVAEIASEYIQILRLPVSSNSEAYRKAGAGLLAQCFTLKGKLINVLEYSMQGRVYQEEAIRYSDLSGQAGVQTLAYREMAYLYWQKEEYSQALSYAEAAARCARNADSSMQSYALSALAYCRSATEEGASALSTLEQAQNLFDSSMLPLTIPYSASILSMSVGTTHFHVGNYQTAASFYEASMASPDVSALGLVQASIKRATIEAYRDDGPRDMELAINHWERGIIGAKELGSKQFKQEARKTYTLLVAAWPREDAVKKLRLHL